MTNRNFKFYWILFVPYCYGLAAFFHYLIEGTFSSSSRLFRLLFVLAFFSAYPIFAKGQMAYWEWIGEWTFVKWVLAGLVVAAVPLVIVSVFAS